MRRGVKAVARGLFVATLLVRRRLARARGEERWVLAGTCGRCAKCCEEPSLRVDRVTWHLPTARRLFLWWQRAVNGFELAGEERRQRVFSFRCTHFDATTRRCDSYGARPGICRDYPRALLDQPWPEFFGGCGFRAVAKNADGMLVALGRTGLSPEELETLARKLNLR